MLLHKNQPTHSMALFFTHKCTLTFSFRMNFGFMANIEYCWNSHSVGYLFHFS